VISVVFLPQYFRGEMFTAYELIRRRFGERLRALTAGTFLIIRSLAEGVRVFAISIVVSVILGTGEIASITLIVALTLFYTFEGGMTAVIWTDVIQMCLYVLGAALSFVVILHSIPGGWGHVVEVAGPLGKLNIFDFQFALTAKFFATPYTFWAGVAGGCFLTTASHGTDQLMVQRLLSARTQAESRTALLASWVVILIQFTLFLLIGVMLFVFYTEQHLPSPQPPDRLYPQFIWQHLPVGVAGIIMAAILAAAMANISAALNSLASTTIVDFYQPHFSKDESRYVWLSRVATVAWGLVLLCIGILARKWGSVLETGLAIASIPFGALLGVFLLGTLTKRVTENQAIAGMLAGLAIMTYVRFETKIAFTWYVLIGTSVTFAVAYVGTILSDVFGRKELQKL